MLDTENNSNNEEHEFKPNYAVPPGETLLEVLEDKGMTQKELALRTNRPLKTINEIVQGKAAITPETAIQFERVLGVPARLWNTMERNYREDLARLQDEKILQAQLPFLNETPVKTVIKNMIKQNWLKKCDNAVDQLRELLQFFGVVATDQLTIYWEYAYKESVFRQAGTVTTDEIAVAAWLRKGELEAEIVDCKPYDATKFREALTTIRSLTKQEPEIFQSELVNICAECGVAVVFVPELPRTGLCGATYWITPTKALIQLSLRYKSDDQLWFTFFHEAGHVLLHNKREVYLEGNSSISAAKEDEANKFAADWLIPPDQLSRFLAENRPYTINSASIMQFAQWLGIAPGIVVGRLQHDGVISFSACNELKQRYKWVEVPDNAANS